MQFGPIEYKTVTNLHDLIKFCPHIHDSKNIDWK